MVGAADCPVGAQFRLKKQSTDGKTTMPVAPAPALIYDVDKEKNMHKEETEDGVDAALIALLALLWEARQDAPGKPWSLAKLAKRAGVQMSTLLRQLNALSSAGLVTVATAESGGGSALLSAAGAELCAGMFVPPPAQ
jgi:hypothetical protein